MLIRQSAGIDTAGSSEHAGFAAATASTLTTADDLTSKAPYWLYVLLACSDSNTSKGLGPVGGGKRLYTALRHA